MGIFSVSATTASILSKADPSDRIEVEIGDSKQPDFKPQMKIMRWDNEVNFSLRAQEQLGAEVRQDGDILKYITADYEVHQYDKPDAGEDGGFEFEWVLPKRPSKNVLLGTIQTKDLEIFYQPALTDEDILNGMKRDEDTVGSYVLAHKYNTGDYSLLGGKNYRAGIVAKIYRPKIVDAQNKWIWGELFINQATGELKVTIDQNFLDSAVYPVVVDPTFGYSTGLTGTSIGIYTTQPFATASLVTLSETGTPTSMSGYVICETGVTGDIKAAIYSSDRATKTNDTDSSTGYNTPGSWLTINISSSTQLSAADYYLAIIGNRTAGSNWINIAAYSTGGTGYREARASYAFGSSLGGSSNANRIQVYATYTAGGDSVYRPNQFGLLGLG